VPVSFAYQHAAGVRAADTSNLAALEHLDRLGLGLLGHFHSHPGFGPEANHPSMTDLRFAERLARGSHIALGGIFTRERGQKDIGYVRFFADESKPFVVDIRGKDEHVRKVSDNVYRVAVADADLSLRAD
jgi:hypothetical protein